MNDRTAGVWPRIRALLRREEERGSSLIEFALVLPILLVVATSTVVFGITLNNYMILTNAVSIGARQLAISRGQTTDPCATTVSAVELAAPTLTAASLSFSYSLNGVSYSGTSCSSASTTTGAAGNLVQGQPARVTVTYPCSLAAYGKNYAANCTLSSTLTELVQ